MKQKILIFTIMLSFFGFGKINAQKNNISNKNVSTDEANGIIGEYYENDLPVIMKFINDIPDKKIISKLPFLTVVSWKYDGTENNGMPSSEVNKRMIILEDEIISSMNSTDIFTHVYSRTGNNLKEFACYSKSQKAFMKLLNRTLEKHDEYPIEINFYVDKEWVDFKNVIADFKK